MFPVRQAILLVLVGSAFALLLRMYRKQNAIEESFLCGILLMVAGGVVPDAWLLIPVVWWAYTVLWADSLRVYLASVCAILLIGFYVALCWFVLPDSAVTVFVRERVMNAFSRSFCYAEGEAVPSLRWLITAAAATFLGVWSLLTHLSRYSRANVRVQNFLLVAVPFFLLSLLSVLFPARDGASLLFVLLGSAVFFMALYLSAYGFPRIRLPKRSRTSLSNRKWKHRKNPYRM